MKEYFDGFVKGFSGIKVGGGIFANVCHVLIAVAIAMAVIALASRNLYVCTAALALLFTLVLILGWRIINFARANPQAAILDGVQYVQYTQIIQDSKENPRLTVSNYSEEYSTELIPEETKLIIEPGTTETNAESAGPQGDAQEDTNG